MALGLVFLGWSFPYEHERQIHERQLHERQIHERQIHERSMHERPIHPSAGRPYQVPHHVAHY